MLPENVIFEVLSRLPVKAIIHSKTVCKRWRGIISDPYFIKLHISRSRECLLIHECTDLATYLSSPGTLKWVDIEHDEAGFHIDHVKSLGFTGYAPRSSFPFSRLGSVNGLVLCEDQKNDIIYILNPVLNECLTLFRPQNNLVALCYGFGVSSADEYKVVRISCREVFLVLPGFCPVEIEIYTLGTGKWRSLGLTSFDLDLTELISANLYLNSHVYWQFGAENNYDFDMTTETFELYSSPPVHKYLKKILEVVKGRISCIAWSLSGLEIWVMKEKSWFKEIAIQDDIKSYFGAGMWSPSCVVNGLKGTSILLLENHTTNELVVYCLDTDTIVPLDLHGFFPKTITYRPTFLSLHNFGSERVHSI